MSNAIESVLHDFYYQESQAYEQEVLRLRGKIRKLEGKLLRQAQQMTNIQMECNQIRDILHEIFVEYPDFREIYRDLFEFEDLMEQDEEHEWENVNRAIQYDV